MEVINIERPIQRVECPEYSQLDIIAYGADNLYPQRIAGIVASSESGSTCLRRFIDFIIGNGFFSKSLSEVIINDKGETLDDILNLAAPDLGTYGGVALHVNYNVLGRKTTLTHIPFEYCRLKKTDKYGRITQIGVFDNWDGTKMRDGRHERAAIENIDWLPRYDPDNIQKEIEKCGGIDNYKGQILWFSTSGSNVYPVPIYDNAITYMATEEALANVSYRNAKNNFLPATIVVFKAGEDVYDPANDDNNTPERVASRCRDKVKPIQDAFDDMIGDRNSSNVTALIVPPNQEVPTTLDLKGENYDGKFDITTKTSEEKIYASFLAEGWYKLRKNNLGLSSDLIENLYSLYSSQTSRYRGYLERLFTKVLSDWHEPLPANEFKIEPLAYIINKQETTDSSINENISNL